MPEMLKPTGAVMGAGLGKDVALITDGRFSGGSHGFVVGHITPEAYEGGVIGLLQNGDRICIDITQNSITVDLSDEELADRRKNWKRPEGRSEEHTSELQSRPHLVCRLLLEKKKKNKTNIPK